MSHVPLNHAPILYMTFYEVAYRLESFLTFVTNAIVCAAAVRFYRQRALRSVLLISIATGSGALATVLPWVIEPQVYRSSGLAYLTRFMILANMVLWTIGVCWLFREYERREQGPGA